jgi:acyl carrier protein
MAAPEVEIDAELRQRVVGAIGSQLRRLLKRPKPVAEDMHLADELGLSSSLALELLLEIEEQLEIQIDIESLSPDTTRTVGELATYVAGHCRPW